MSDTKRQRIVTAFVERLRQINTQNGYATNAGDLVEDWPRRFDERELAATPSRCALGVCDLTDEHDRPDFEAGFVVNTLTVQVRVFASAEVPAAELRRVIGDVHAAIGVDERFEQDGQCLLIGLKPSRSGFVVPQEAFEISGAAVEFTVTYGTQTFNPYE